jgi:hypothetical protein
MAHVNAEQAVAGAGKMMDSMMGKMDMGSMMKEGMGPMMKEGMGSMMMRGMGSMTKTPGVATGAVVTAGSAAGKSVLKKVFTHPVVLFGLGVVAGCYIYKYRKSILSSSVESEE